MRILTALLGTAALSMAMASPLAAQEKTVVTVVKVTGENWFTRMEEGVKAYGDEHEGIATRQVGPAKADAAQQAAIIPVSYTHLTLPTICSV